MPRPCAAKGLRSSKRAVGAGTGASAEGTVGSTLGGQVGIRWATARRRGLLLGAAVALAGGCTAPAAPPPIQPTTSGPSAARTTSEFGAGLHPVVKVTDGDTITVSVDGIEERVRLIGIDSPELHRPVECFGSQAADHLTELLTGASVQLIADPSQDDRDRYGRLLRYVELADGTDVNAELIRDGYAFEYTYDKPYRRQTVFRHQEAAARSAAAGLWSTATCGGRGSAEPGTGRPSGAVSATTSSAPVNRPAGCAIKGNIDRRGERIFHLPGDSSYDETVISETKGERYFCTVAEAEAAGWRAADR